MLSFYRAAAAIGIISFPYLEDYSHLTAFLYN